MSGHSIYERNIKAATLAASASAIEILQRNPDARLAMQACRDLRRTLHSQRCHYCFW